VPRAAGTGESSTGCRAAGTGESSTGVRAAGLVRVPLGVVMLGLVKSSTGCGHAGTGETTGGTRAAGTGETTGVTLVLLGLVRATGWPLVLPDWCKTLLGSMKLPGVLVLQILLDPPLGVVVPGV